MFGALFTQDKISLENVLDGTFRTESIGRYDWKNSSDSYYFSKRSDEGLEFYEYNLASNDTLKAFTVKKNIITNFSYSFSPDQTKLLFEKEFSKTMETFVLWFILCIRYIIRVFKPLSLLILIV